MGGFVLLFVLYFALRLTNLTGAPIFTDEAIYIRWSQIGSRDAAWRFISLTDGKQPMFTWAMMVTLKIFSDPLFAGRVVSVGAGFVTLIGIGFLSYEVFRNKLVTFFSCLFYVLSPYSLVYDRMALYDSLVAAFSVWSLYLEILLVRQPRLDVALMLGFVLGGGMLNKTSGFLSLYLLPMTLVLFDWKKKDLVKRLMCWGFLVLVATLLSQVLYSVLRLSPFFHMIKQKDAVFVYPLAEWWEFKFRHVSGNLQGLVDWLQGYLTWPMLVVACVPFLSWQKQLREKLLLLAWWVVPFVGLATFARILYPRFILFMTMPLVVLIALGMSIIYRKLSNRLVLCIIFASLMLPLFITDIWIVQNPLLASIPKSDKSQYMEDWPSGWGVKEVTKYLADEAEQSPISVYTEGTFGLLPYALEIYLVDNPNIKIQGMWPLPVKMPEQMEKDALTRPTFFVMNQVQEQPRWPLTLLAEYAKGRRTDRTFRLYKVIPPIADAYGR